MGLKWRDSDLVKAKRGNNLAFKEMETGITRAPKDTRNSIVMSHNASNRKDYDEAFVRLHQDRATSKMYYDLLNRTKADDMAKDWHRGREYWDTRPEYAKAQSDRQFKGKKVFGAQTNIGKVGSLDYPFEMSQTDIMDDKVRAKGYRDMKKWVETSIRHDPDKAGGNKLDKYSRLTISLYILGKYPRLHMEVRRSPSFTMYEKWVKKNGK